MHLIRPPSLKAPLRYHVSYYAGMFSFLLARQIGEAVVGLLTGAASVLLAVVVLGTCSLIAYFRV